MNSIACFNPTVPVVAQIVIGLVLFVIVLRGMRHHSVAYTGLVMLAAVASFSTQNLSYVALAILGAMVIGLLSLCTRSHAKCSDCNN